MPNVHFRTTSDVKDLEKDYAKVQRENAKLIQQNQKLADASRKAQGEAKRSNTETNSGLEATVGNLAKVAAGYFSVTAGIAAVNAALEEKKRLEKESADANISVARSQQQVILNLAGQSDETIRGALKDLTEVRRETGFESVAPLNVAFANAVSAIGGDFAEARPQALGNVRLAAEVSGGREDLLEIFSGGISDVAKASGRTDPRENLGFLLSAGQQSRVTDPAQQASQIGPSAKAVQLTDTTGEAERATREGGALFAAISNISQDKEGRRTATATIALASQLKEFFREDKREEIASAMAGQIVKETVPDDADSLFRKRAKKEAEAEARERVKQIQDPGHAFGRLEALQKDETLLETFLSGASFERKSEEAVRDLIKGGETFKVAQTAFRNIKFDAPTTEGVRRQVTGLTPQIQLQQTEAAGKGVREAGQLRDIEGGRTDVAREQLTAALETTTGVLDAFPALGRNDLALHKFERRVRGGQDPADAAAEIIEHLRRELTMPTASGGVGGAGVTVPRQLSDDEQAQLKTLNEMLAELKKMRQEAGAAARSSGARSQPGRQTE